MIQGPERTEITTLQADLLVIGAGMAGLSAGAWAARQGATVVVVDRGHEPGGSAALSGGYLWTAPSRAALRVKDPDGDPDLAEMIVDDFPSGVDFVREFGVNFSDPVTIQGWGHGFQFDVVRYLQRCQSVIEGAGGWVLPRVDVQALRLRDTTRVSGAHVMDADGPADILADHTILATGGFQADAELRGRAIHPNASAMLLRANPHSRGDGLRLAREVGAAANLGRGGFYGHLVCRPITEFEPRHFIQYTQYHSEHSLLLNLHGERFTVESEGDHISNQAVLRQPESRALLVADDRVWSTWGSTPSEVGLEAVDRYRTAQAAGAHVATAGDISGLAQQAAAWGYNPRGIEATVASHNAATPDAAIPALIQPPFRAVEVQPTITFTFGGLRIDQHARALREDGTIVEGLLVAGADAGGVYAHGYAGGLALALVLGLRAASTALSIARERR
jgi:succinate dehydrogenase/fumarate reductase flavoprotein subunit